MALRIVPGPSQSFTQTPNFPTGFRTQLLGSNLNFSGRAITSRFLMRVTEASDDEIFDQFDGNLIKHVPSGAFDPNRVRWDTLEVDYPGQHVLELTLFQPGGPQFASLVWGGFLHVGPFPGGYDLHLGSPVSFPRSATPYDIAMNGLWSTLTGRLETAIINLTSMANTFNE